MINFNFQNPLDDRLNSTEKEFQVINEIITSKTVQMEHFHEVKPDLFHDVINKEIYNILNLMYEQDKDINVTAIRSFIKLNVAPQQVRQIEDQIDIALTYGASDTFGNMLKDLDTLRKNRILFDEIIGTAKTKFINNEPIEDIIQDITESIISMEGGKEDRTTYADHVDMTMAQIEDPDKHWDFIKLRWEEWNNQFGGVIKDRYYLVGGESGAGKTAFVTDMISQISQDYGDKAAILFFSYEMSQSRVIARLISKEVRFTERQLKQRFKKLTESEIRRVREAAERIKNYPLDIVYQTLSDNELKMRARRFALKNKGKHLFIFLDHIGLVDGNEKDMRVKTIKTSKVLKSFATDYKASVFVLTQLKKELTDSNNQTNRNNFHRPNDSHIMESGALKADADVVVLLWRPDMRNSVIAYDGHGEFDVRGKLIMCNYKNRDGQAPTDLVFGCDIKYSHIYNLENPFDPGMTESVKQEMMKAEQESDEIFRINQQPVF